MEIKSILDWVLDHVGLEATIIFCVIVAVSYFVFLSIIEKLRIGKGESRERMDWWTIAGKLKEQQHTAQRDYLQFRNKLKNTDAYDNKMLQSLKDRFENAKRQRREHLKHRPIKKSYKILKLLLLIFVLLIAIYLFVKYRELIMMIL